jgi:hypothetical protein
MAHTPNELTQFPNRSHQPYQNTDYYYALRPLFEPSTDVYSTNLLPSIPFAAQPQAKPSATSTMSYQCTICRQKSYNTKDSWKNHEAMYTNFKRLKCCAHTFPVVRDHCAVCLSKDTSEQHMSTHQNEEKPQQYGRFIYIYELGKHL